MEVTASLKKKLALLGLTEGEVYKDLPSSVLVPISDVTPNDWNPKTCGPDRLLQIASSLKQHGWLPNDLPLLWRDPACPDVLTIINGEHRWLICAASGFLHYPGKETTAPKTREDAIALTMAFEEAKARRDSAKFQQNLTDLAVAGRDEDLRTILRVKDPEALRQKRAAFAAGLREKVAAGGTAATAPRMVALTFTGAQYDAYQAALGAARTRLKQAGETVGMIEEFAALTDAEVVALAAEARVTKCHKTAG